MNRIEGTFVAETGPSSSHNRVNPVGEQFLFWGLGCLAVGAGLLQFVMIGLLGILFFLVALGLLFAAGILIRDVTIPRTRSFAGLALFTLAMVVLVLTAAQASMLAFDKALHDLSPRWVPPTEPVPPLSPAAPVWPVVILGSAIASLLLALGLRLRTGWPLRRILIWVAIVLLVCPVALLIFFTLAPVLPLTT